MEEPHGRRPLLSDGKKFEFLVRKISSKIGFNFF